MYKLREQKPFLAWVLVSWGQGQVKGCNGHNQCGWDEKILTTTHTILTFPPTKFSAQHCRGLNGWLVLVRKSYSQSSTMTGQDLWLARHHHGDAIDFAHFCVVRDSKISTQAAYDMLSAIEIHVNGSSSKGQWRSMGRITRSKRSSTASETHVADWLWWLMVFWQFRIHVGTRISPVPVCKQACTFIEYEYGHACM